MRIDTDGIEQPWQDSGSRGRKYIQPRVREIKDVAVLKKLLRSAVKAKAKMGRGRAKLK